MRPALPQDWVQAVDDRAADSPPTLASPPSPSLPYPTAATIDTSSAAPTPTPTLATTEAADDAVPVGGASRQAGSGNATEPPLEQADLSASTSMPHAPSAAVPAQLNYAPSSSHASSAGPQEPGTARRHPFIVEQGADRDSRDEQHARPDGALATQGPTFAPTQADTQVIQPQMQARDQDLIAAASGPATYDSSPAAAHTASQDLQHALHAEDLNQAAQQGRLPGPAEALAADGSMEETAASRQQAPISRSTQDQSGQTRGGDQARYMPQSGPQPVPEPADMPPRAGPDSQQSLQPAAPQSHASLANQGGKVTPEVAVPQSAARLSLEAMIPPPFEFGSPTGSPNFPATGSPNFPANAAPRTHSDSTFQSPTPPVFSETVHPQASSGGRLQHGSEAAGMVRAHGPPPQQASPPPPAGDTSHAPEPRRLASSEVQRRIEQTAAHVQQAVNERAEVQPGGTLGGGPSDALARATGTLKALAAGHLEEAETLSRSLPADSGE